MKIMRLLNALTLKFEKADWSKNPEFGLIDTILEMNPELFTCCGLANDITVGVKESEFGRKDIPTVEQIVRAAIYKEMKGLDYRELEYAQSDSRICANFIKLDMRKPYSFQMFQKYISKIKEASLQKFLVAINKISIGEGLEDLTKLKQDSTVVKSNIHYPTNNALVWDCIKESHRLLEHLNEEINDKPYRDYLKSAKKTYYKINNTKSENKRTELFRKQLVTFTKTINQVSNAVKKKLVPNELGIMALSYLIALEDLLPLLDQVYHMTYWREIKKQPVPNEEKIFSIYERHADIIVKGGREIQFGHKVNLAVGKSNLILDCKVVRGNPSDTSLYQPTIERITANYNKIPRDISCDGGYASNENIEYSRKKGIINIVFYYNWRLSFLL